MTILLYVYILFTISIIVDFLYISYIVIYIHISVSSNLKRIFFIIVEYRISCIQFFKKKFNCFFLRIFYAVYVYFLYTYDTFKCHHKFFVVTIIDFMFAHPLRCSIIFIKFMKHFPFSSVSYVARQ